MHRARAVVRTCAACDPCGAPPGPGTHAAYCTTARLCAFSTDSLARAEARLVTGCSSPAGRSYFEQWPSAAFKLYSGTRDPVSESHNTTLTFFSAAYLLVEWESEEEKGDHSIIEGKLVHLQDRASGFVAGAKVECRLKEGTYPATIITAGCYRPHLSHRY